MSLKKKNIPGSFLLSWYKKDISSVFLRKLFLIAGIVFLLVAAVFCFEVYMPVNPFSHLRITYSVQKGMGDDQIAKELQDMGVIRNNYFFRLYAVLSFKHSSLQAGKYIFSPSMSVYQIAKKLAQGDVIKEKITIQDGWNTRDIGKYLELKGICSKDDFIKLANQDWSSEFEFLKEKPKNISVEGYLFPDTYEISEDETCQDIIKMMLANFDRKITPEIKNEIAAHNKSLFEIITVASLVEEEVNIVKDKAIVAGIIYKRLQMDMPLQIDSTVNYATGKNNRAVALADLQVDSLYNTYKYKGLPEGPISNPGTESIMAAINPAKTSYLYYLSGYDGQTIFSATLAEHNAAKAQYLTH